MTASSFAPRLRATLPAVLGLALASAFTPVIAAQAQANPPADALAQDYQPSPAIWRLADEDTTIYLFGSVHLLPRGFSWRSAQFDAIVEEAEMLVLESSDADAQSSLADLAGKMAKVAASRAPTSLQLAPPVRSKWQTLAEATGRPFAEVDTMPLPLALLEFGFSGAAGTGVSSYQYGVESVLEREFARAGKPVGSIENHGAVLLALMRVDEAAILQELEAELAAWPGKTLANFRGGSGWSSGAQDWSMEHDWARGKVQEDFDLGLGGGKLGAAFNRVLLDRRNTAWAAWLDNRLDEPGSILVAVGAGHFEGPHSVLARLEARGLKAERIN